MRSLVHDEELQRTIRYSSSRGDCRARRLRSPSDDACSIAHGRHGCDVSYIPFQCGDALLIGGTLATAKPSSYLARAFHAETDGSYVLTARMMARSVLALPHWLDSLHQGE